MVFYELRKVQKVAGGESLSIVIPKDIADELEITGGDYVRIKKEEDRIIMEKVSNE